MSLPESLEKFIVRCYSDIPPEDHPTMEVQLKELVTTAIKNGKQFEIDWDRMVLPIHTARLLRGNIKPVAGKRKFEEHPKQPRTAMKPPPSRPPAAPPTNSSPSDAELRRKRFANNQPRLYVDEISLEPVIGRATTLEKGYLRLTGPPNPEVVRPKRVLKKAVAHVIKQYETKARAYPWVADQFRAIRQDLTVQRLQDAFAIKVYEKNVRIALENKDMGEYNQCLTRLKELYQSDLEFVSLETGEFTAYRIFYLLYTNKLEDIGVMMESCIGTKDGAILHALEVVRALVAGNRARLFALYQQAPNLGKAALDQIIERERIVATAATAKATKGMIDLGYLKASMGFESLEVARDFLRRWLPIDDATEEVDSSAVSTALEEAKKGIYQVDIKGQI